MLLSTATKTGKALLLFVAILLAVTLIAAVVGCLFLPDGHFAYLLDPEKLFWYCWSKRSGLKIQIFFVTTVIWWMMTLAGALDRPWRIQVAAWSQKFSIRSFHVPTP